MGQYEIRFPLTEDDRAALDRIERLVREFNEIVEYPPPRDQIHALFTAALIWAKAMDEEGGLAQVRAANEEQNRGARH